MARQTGPLKYQGTIGDIRHFKIKGLKGSCILANFAAYLPGACPKLAEILSPI